MTKINVSLNQEKFEEIWRHISVINKEMGGTLAELKELRKDNQGEHELIKSSLNEMRSDQVELRERVKWLLWLTTIVIIAIVGGQIGAIFR